MTTQERIEHYRQLIAKARGRDNKRMQNARHAIINASVLQSLNEYAAQRHIEIAKQNLAAIGILTAA